MPEPSIASLARQAKRIVASSASSRAEKFDALYQLARAHTKAGNEAEAARACSDARSFLPPVAPDNANSVAFVLLGSAQHQALAANVREADRQFDRAVAHAGEWCDSETADAARLAYARFLHQQRQYRQATTLLLPLAKDKKNSLAETHQILASCHLGLRKFELAMTSYRDALRILTESGRKTARRRAFVCCDMARALRLAGQVSYAQQYLREAEMLNADSDKQVAARLLCEEAALEFAANHCDAAIKRYELAVELMQRNHQEETLEFAEAIIGLAMGYLACHRHAPVEALLISALRITRSRLGRRSFESSLVLSKLAGFYKREGRFVEASALLTGVEAIQGKAHLADRMMDSSINFEAGMNYQADGHHVLALNRFKQALSEYEKRDPAKSYESVAIHIRMHQIYDAVNDKPRADSHYAEAGKILHEMFGFQQPDPFRCAMTLAACFELQDKDDYAESFYIYALTTADRNSAPQLLLEARDEYIAMLERNGRTADAKAARSRWRKPRVTSPRRGSPVGAGRAGAAVRDSRPI